MTPAEQDRWALFVMRFCEMVGTFLVLATFFGLALFAG
jgi:hypothetical protein